MILYEKEYRCDPLNIRFRLRINLRRKTKLGTGAEAPSCNKGLHGMIHRIEYVFNKRYAAVKVRKGARTPHVPGCGHPEDRILRGLLRIRWLRTAGLGLLPRKEVIQPHVLVRLPCYDFTPLTLHTFDASLPKGLGRRLRVQTTRVV